MDWSHYKNDTRIPATHNLDGDSTWQKKHGAIKGDTETYSRW